MQYFLKYSKVAQTRARAREKTLLPRQFSRIRSEAQNSTCRLLAKIVPFCRLLAAYPPLYLKQNPTTESDLEYEQHQKFNSNPPTSLAHATADSYSLTNCRDHQYFLCLYTNFLAYLANNSTPNKKQCAL